MMDGHGRQQDDIAERAAALSRSAHAIYSCIFVKKAGNSSRNALSFEQGLI
jgi:hypothetical protein